MSKSERRLRPNRHSKIETLEDRLAMSADPLGGMLGGAITHHGAIADDIPMEQHAPPTLGQPAMQHGTIDPPPLTQHGQASQPGQISHHVGQTPDFWIDPYQEDIASLEDTLGDLERSLASAHNTTGLNTVRANYGFTGGGQTVAVIDSGIAYDHYALGGGFGTGFRVVGGWDFTNENDADPYDDGPEGSHGTHVAGIIGSSDSTDQGVAPDVDLVGLRVFDDNGAGFFSWVENALDWVLANRNAFENPITAINLSLGTNWNSSQVPGWANLEDEFQQLEQAGIFIAVSAGNSFQSFNTPGLSYPAASPFVVPVMSVDDSGGLSNFSQRHQRAIAAPGRWIRSTVPDYAGNNNGIADDWANFSGTSMAAPYVAGASVLIREAMLFNGITNITQDMIYDHMMATADTFWDSATQANYSRLNLGAAIDALMPQDDFGSSVFDAHSLGTITAGAQQQSLADVSGVITTLSDSDYFTFTAGSTGTVTFTATNTTHDLDAVWDGNGGNGWTNPGGQSYTIEVVAGQQYSIGISSGDGLGYYDLAVTAEQTFSFTDWGAVANQTTRTGLTAGAQTWYRVVAGQDGFLSIDALYDTGTVDIDLYDANLNLIDSGAANRVDNYTTAGTEFFLSVEGLASDLDIRLTNLVSLSGSIVNVGGTAGDDALAFTAGQTQHTVSVNGLGYTFDAAQYDTFNLDAGAGTDSISLTGTSGADSAWLAEDSSQLNGVGYSVDASGFDSTVVVSGGGNDIARIYDSSGNDTYAAHSDYAELTLASGDTLRTEGFGQNWAFASTGEDVARLYDTAGNDTLRAYHDKTTISGDNYFNYVRMFDQVWAYASSGVDSARFYDSDGADTFRAYHDKATMTGDGYWNYARGFDSNTAYSTSGADVARFYDSAGNDLYYGYADRAVMTGAGFNNTAYAFGNTIAYSSGGTDIARLYDSAGDDRLYAYHNRSVLEGDGFSNEANAFAQVWSYASGGEDIARLYDSAGDDVLRAYHDKATLTGDGFFNYARAFEQTWSYASEGNDIANIYGTPEDDVLRVYHDKALIAGSLTFNYARLFDQTFAFGGGGGNDVALLYDSPDDDTLTASGSTARIQSTAFDYTVDDFDRVTARRSTGNDVSDVSATDYVFEELGGWA